MSDSRRKDLYDHDVWRKRAEEAEKIVARVATEECRHWPRCTGHPIKYWCVPCQARATLLARKSRE